MRIGLSWLRILSEPIHFLCLGLRSRTSLAAENLFLRRQLAFYQERKVKPRRADNPTRLTLVLLSRWFNCRDSLTVVRPKTLVAWHPRASAFSGVGSPKTGRRPIPAALQHLIRKMACENPSGGEERIANELLLKLGLRVSPRTIRKYLPKLPAAPPGGPRGDQRWASQKVYAEARIGVSEDHDEIADAIKSIWKVLCRLYREQEDREPCHDADLSLESLRRDFERELEKIGE